MHLLTRTFAAFRNMYDAAINAGTPAISTLKEAALLGLQKGARSFQTFDVTTLVDGDSALPDMPARNWSVIHYVGVDAIYSPQETLEMRRVEINNYDPAQFSAEQKKTIFNKISKDFQNDDPTKIAYIRGPFSQFRKITPAQHVYNAQGRQIWPSVESV